MLKIISDTFEENGQNFSPPPTKVSISAYKLSAKAQARLGHLGDGSEGAGGGAGRGRVRVDGRDDGDGVGFD
eukprot:592137-Rhodomonas_salina.1